MDDYSIRKKFFVLYILCILLPLVITDSIIVTIVIRSENISRSNEMEDIANAVGYSLSSRIDQADQVGKNIYTDKELYDFLDRNYVDAYDYVTSYQRLKKSIWTDDISLLNNMKLTLYSDNDTMVNGGGFITMDRAVNEEWYKEFTEFGQKQMLYFGFDGSSHSSLVPQRKIMFIRRMDYYRKEREKFLVLELDYGGINRYFKEMNYSMDVFVCCDGKIVLSNGNYASIGKDFEDFHHAGQVGFQKTLEMYGARMEICVMNEKTGVIKEIRKNLPIILFLVLTNAVFPILMLLFLHRSFTVRLRILRDTFKNMDDENLMGIEQIQGRDEIGSLMLSYNKMAERINSLIQIVYKNRIKEQEITVARQRAELLALRSQINPHFLFNTLESIRMHSVIKNELETADMVEKLAVLMRQYVDWGEDLVEVGKEMEFVRAYLAIQKYRFGDKLFYEIHVEESCTGFTIPKLTIVTFVENACVHGIENKSAPGWIFVRLYQKEDDLYLEIEDTGMGMGEEEMEMLLWKMRHASIELLQEKQGVGVINACLRLNMETDGKAEFEIDGEESLGFMVQIKLPCRYLRT